MNNNRATMDFFLSSPYPNNVIEGYYDLKLVFFSYVVAVFSSYVALNIAGTIRSSSINKMDYWKWLIAGAIVMGMGIWTMHFVGMLAYMTQMPMEYNHALTFISLGIAVLASGFALFWVGQNKVSLRTILIAGIFMGLAIASMHYIGMIAMQNMQFKYIPSLFFLSIAIAIVASQAALWMIIKGTTYSWIAKLNILSAMLMGAGICGMHYVGMAATVITGDATTMAMDGNQMQSGFSPMYFVASATVIMIIFLAVSSNTQKFLISLQKSNEILKAKEVEIADACKRAEAANRAKSSFLANMSHELRTPLNAIIGYSEMLQEEAIEEGKVKQIEDFDKIISSGKHLLSLINDVLDLSKLEAGKIEIYIENVEIKSFIHDIDSIIAPLLKMNHNTFEQHIDSDLPTMYTDITRLRQCLLNLFSNACKFTRNGHVTLTVKKEGKNILISVSDTGIGMSSDQIAKLFKAFSQADISTTRHYGGTGLGLYLTKQFVEMLDGSIEVESVLGKGSTFTIKLPIISQVESIKKAPLIPEMNKSLEKTILIIDENPNTYNELQDGLKGERFEILKAFSREESLKIAREQHPDVITLALDMKLTDGWSIFRDLKADRALSNIPVVLLISPSEKSIHSEINSIDYIHKPINAKELIRKINKLTFKAEKDVILVVDDDKNVREFLCRIIEKDGWKSVQAKNGQEALECISKHIPAIILLDLMMPVMDGFEMINALQIHDTLQKIPLVVITSKDLSRNEREILTKNSRVILQKGANTRQELLKAIRERVKN